MTKKIIVFLLVFLYPFCLMAAEKKVVAAPLNPVLLEKGKKLYDSHCAECHHSERYGLVGPPLLPEYFGRKKDKQIESTILNGLPSTNMPPFKDKLKEGDVKAVIAYIKSPVEKPLWGIEQMRDTWQISYFDLDERKPKYDMTNFFMIVEGGKGTVHFMDGDKFKLLGSVHVGAIHGGPKFGPNLRYSYAVSRDGWLVKYDLIDLREVGRIRGGISTRNIAVSGDNKYIAQVNLLPKNIVIIDAFTMKPKEVIDPEATPGAVYELKKRGVFVVSLKNKSEILVINNKDLKVEHIKIDQPFTDFFIDPSERYLVGTSRGSDHFSVVDLDKEKVIKTVESQGGMPHLASAAVWKDKEGTFAAFPHIGKADISVIEMYTWKVKGKVKTKGAGFFARTHDKIRQIWADTGTDTIQIVDKKSLRVIRELVPQKGKQAMHIEFNKDGSRALVSVWEDDGEVVIYDTKNFKVVKRMPFKKPVGKYNATNKRF